MRFIILSTSFASISFVSQVNGACKQQTSAWKDATRGCIASLNEKLLPKDQWFHCGRPSTNGKPDDLCCGAFVCDQYSRQEIVKKGSQSQWDIHCVTAPDCGGAWSLAFDQTDCGNINGCYQGGQCCSKKSQPGAVPSHVPKSPK